MALKQESTDAWSNPLKSKPRRSKQETANLLANHLFCYLELNSEEIISSIEEVTTEIREKQLNASQLLLDGKTDH